MTRTSNFLLVVAAGLAAMLQSVPAHAVSYVTRIADGNNVGVTLTNYGVLGNNFVNRSASLEYPLGTGYEHLVHGGLWIGAHATDGSGGFVGVVTGMLDATQGEATSILTEFTPSGDVITRRSYDPGSDYDPAAISNLDMSALFNDATPKTALFNPEPHRPMGLAVRQVSHQWTLSGREHFAIERFIIQNTGGFPLTDVHVGLYLELASGPKNAYSTWPPTSLGSIYGSWFGKALLAWDSSQRILREHRCSGPPVPAACQFEITPAWIGVQLLTPPQAGQGVTVAAWNYAPGNTARDQDVERYALMSAGTTADFSNFQPGSSDPNEVLALGPFAQIAPGDSIEVDFALVGGTEVADLQQHAATAQAVHDAGYVNPLLGVGDSRTTGPVRLAPAANPMSRTSCNVIVELASGASSRLELFDATGRRRVTRDLGAPGAGRHIVHLDEVSGLAPGLYFLKLTSGMDVARSRVVVLP